MSVPRSTGTGVDDATHVDELLPLAAVHRKPRDLASCDGSDLAEADLGDHPLEAAPAVASRRRTTQILVDHRDLFATPAVSVVAAWRTAVADSPGYAALGAATTEWSKITSGCFTEMSISTSAAAMTWARDTSASYATWYPPHPKDRMRQSFSAPLT